MSNLSQPTELQDVVNTLRTILEVSRLTQVPSQGAVVVRGTPDQLALAEWLINNLDKARPEVIVDVSVMVVNRENIKDLGINPPTSASVALLSNTTSTSSTSSSTSSTTSSTTGTTGQINLNTIGNLTAKNFVVSIPQSTLNFMLSDSKTKLLQNPQIRALDGQKASLKIGQRVPVATGSFGAGVGGVGVANTLVNTQFQYLDVGVNIEITPRIHPGREVSMKLTMDVSDVDSYVSIGGINQPVIGQRKIEHEIRLKDGEANLLGGILEDQDVKTVSGYPFLANIPILKYLFSENKTDRTQNELVFVLVPHIVRGQDLSALNLKALDVGTANAIQLRQLSVNPPAKPAAETKPAPAAGQPAAGRPAPIPGPTASAIAPAGAPAPGAALPSKVLLSFNPDKVNTSVGQTFMMDVMVSGAQNLFSAPLQIQYDPTKLQVVNVSSGNFLGKGEQPVALAQRNDTASGTMQVTANRPPNSGGVSGQGQLLTLTFVAKDSGEALVAITRAGLHDASNQSLEAAGTQAKVNIKNR
jgi:general secretion pathway protein D